MSGGRDSEASRRLEQADIQLESAVTKAGRALRSLSPERELMTPLEVLGSQLLAGEGSELADEVSIALHDIAVAELRNFPENIFWDFDYTAAALLRTGRERGLPSLVESRRLIVGLQDLFGRHTEIRFRYGHDFIYGFDWAKWVARSPQERATIGPFDLEFLRYLYRRGEELLELIAEGDTKYPRLETEASRNPFEFVREPAQETCLFESLAARGLIPVQSWRMDASPDWRRDYQALRAQRARELGLSSTSEDPGVESRC